MLNVVMLSVVRLSVVRLSVVALDKHTSLLRAIANYASKMFYSIGTWQTYQGLLIKDCA
jgi:hypothetical protein